MKNPNDEISKLKLEIAGLGITIEGQQLAVMALERKVIELKSALKPFAYQAKIIDDNDKQAGHGPEEPILSFKFQGSYTAITLGDCRKAREVLK